MKERFLAAVDGYALDRELRVAVHGPYIQKWCTPQPKLISVPLRVRGGKIYYVWWYLSGVGAFLYPRRTAISTESLGVGQGSWPVCHAAVVQNGRAYVLLYQQAKLFGGGVVCAMRSNTPTDLIIKASQDEGAMLADAVRIPMEIARRMG